MHVSNILYPKILANFTQFWGCEISGWGFCGDVGIHILQITNLKTPFHFCNENLQLKIDTKIAACDEGYQNVNGNQSWMAAEILV